MNKFLAFLILINSTIIAHIQWTDLSGTFEGFYRNHSTPNLNAQSKYSPMFGAMALISGSIKYDLAHAHEKNNTLVTFIFALDRLSDSISVTQNNSQMMLSLTPEIAGRLLLALESNTKEAWEDFKDRYAQVWQKTHQQMGFDGASNLSDFKTKKINPLKKAYDTFCNNNDTHKQKAREYFAALICLQGSSVKDLEDYLHGLGFDNIILKETSEERVMRYENLMKEWFDNSDIKFLRIRAFDFDYAVIYLLPQNNDFKTLMLDYSKKFKNIPRCAETSIANILTLLLYHPSSKKLNLSYLPEQVQQSINPLFKKFVENLGALNGRYSEKQFVELIMFLSNISEVDYIKEDSEYRDELKCSLDNYIRLLNFLFGTTAKSFEDLAQKLSTNDTECSFSTSVSQERFVYDIETVYSINMDITRKKEKVTLNATAKIYEKTARFELKKVITPIEEISTKGPVFDLYRPKRYEDLSKNLQVPRNLLELLKPGDLVNYYTTERDSSSLKTCLENYPYLNIATESNKLYNKFKDNKPFIQFLLEFTNNSQTISEEDYSAIINYFEKNKVAIDMFLSQNPQFLPSILYKARDNKIAYTKDFLDLIEHLVEQHPKCNSLKIIKTNFHEELLLQSMFFSYSNKSNQKIYPTLERIIKILLKHTEFSSEELSNLLLVAQNTEYAGQLIQHAKKIETLENLINQVNSMKISEEDKKKLINLYNQTNEITK